MPCHRPGETLFNWSGQFHSVSTYTMRTCMQMIEIDITGNSAMRILLQRWCVCVCVCVCVFWMTLCLLKLSTNLHCDVYLEPDS